MARFQQTNCLIRTKDVMETIEGTILSEPVRHEDIVEFDLHEDTDGIVHCVSRHNFLFPAFKQGQKVVLGGDRIEVQPSFGYFTFVQLCQNQSN